MSAAPSISLVDYGPGIDPMTTNLGIIKYLIYADETGQFEDYQEWVESTNTSPTELEIANSETYSSYAIRLECDFSGSVPAERHYAACCIENPSVTIEKDVTVYNQSCIVAGEVGTEWKTLLIGSAYNASISNNLTNGFKLADLLSSQTQTADEIPVITLTPNSEIVLSIGDAEVGNYEVISTSGMDYWDCTGSSDFRYICYKLQPQWKKHTNGEYYTDTKARFGPDDGKVFFYLFNGIEKIDDAYNLSAASTQLEKSTETTLEGSVLSQVALSLTAFGAILLSSTY